MSSETQKRPSAPGAPEPAFARGRIQWSRPPQPVFRVGPLPRAEGAPGAPFVARPRPPGPGILLGSMIPPPRAETPQAAAPPPPPPPEPAVEPVPDAVEQPIAEAVEPPVAAASSPRPEPVEIIDAEPVAVAPAPSSDEAPTEPAPRSLPSVVVTPAIYATVSAAIETVTKKDRWILVVAVLAVLVTGGFIWLATLPSGDGAALDVNAPPPAVQGLTVEVVEPPVSTEPVGAVAPERTTPIENRAVAPVRAQPAPARQAAKPTPPPPPPPAAQAQPSIETAPLVITPPTAAQAAPSDPQAPIATGPQPLD